MEFSRCIRLTLAYDGTNYCGWQLQDNGTSIHEELMKAAKGFLKGPFTITGCSRTDSGVHALGFVAALRTDDAIETKKFTRAFQAFLPKDIVVYEAQEMEADFHPRYHAKSKHYRYSIYIYKMPLPQYIRYCHYIYDALDVEAMMQAGKFFVGEHDFIAFSSSKTTVDTTIREIYSLEVYREGDSVHIDVIGNGFLYNMVRMIAGTLIEVGRGKVRPEEISELILSKDRSRTKKTAPAKGLTLVEVAY